MAHMVETMAYAGEVPWHGLGVAVPADLSPRQMMEKAGCDWQVRKEVMTTASGVQVESKQALVRSSDNSILDVVGDNWEPVQNIEAFDFFNEYCAAGDMQMHTAGSLADGKIVWALAKVNESFDVLGDDQVDSYLLFSNPHQYGKSLNVRFTPIRVVCNNTLTLSLSQTAKNEVSLNHRRAFNPDMVKEQLGIAHEKFAQYKEMAQFLAKKTAKLEDVVIYLNEVFPVANSKGRAVDSYADLSRTAKQAFDVLETQPGADMAMGTWWNAVNAVTYLTDHKLGRSADTRMQSAWFGSNQAKKVKAMNLAVEMAA